MVYNRQTDMIPASSIFDSIAHASTMKVQIPTVQQGALLIPPDEDPNVEDNTAKDKGKDADVVPTDSVKPTNQQPQTQPSTVRKGEMRYIAMEDARFREIIAQCATWAKSNGFVVTEKRVEEAIKSHSFFVAIQKISEGVYAPYFCMVTVKYTKDTSGTTLGRFNISTNWEGTEEEQQNFKAWVLTDPRLKQLNQGLIAQHFYMDVIFTMPEKIKKLDGTSWFGAFYAALFSKDKMMIYEASCVVDIWSYTNDLGDDVTSFFVSVSEVGGILYKISLLFYDSEIRRMFVKYTGSFTMVACLYPRQVIDVVQACAEQQMTVYTPYTRGVRGTVPNIYAVNTDFSELTRIVRPYVAPLIAKTKQIKTTNLISSWILLSQGLGDSFKMKYAGQEVEVPTALDFSVDDVASWSNSFKKFMYQHQNQYNDYEKIQKMVNAKGDAYNQAISEIKAYFANLFKEKWQKEHQREPIKYEESSYKNSKFLPVKPASKNKRGKQVTKENQDKVVSEYNFADFM